MAGTNSHLLAVACIGSGSGERGAAAIDVNALESLQMIILGGGAVGKILEAIFPVALQNLILAVNFIIVFWSFSFKELRANKN